MQPSLDNITIYYMKTHDFNEIIDLPALPLFSKEICEMLNQLSIMIRNDKEAKQYTDIVTFGFFCRKSNLMKMKQKYYVANRLGRGFSFHIAPSNVPINFAYSFVLALLSGNACIVRTSSKNFEQTRIICRLLKKIENEYPILKYLAVIGYSHDKGITDFFSLKANTRVIWGGDRTIEDIRKSPTNVRCQDVMFSNRYSVCVINANVLLATNDIDKLIQGFYNDTYLYDQNACSSPQLIYWYGEHDEVLQAQKLFWEKVAYYVENRYKIEPIVVIDKLMMNYRMAIECSDVKIKQSGDNRIVRMQVDKLPKNLDDYACVGGCFVECLSNDLDKLTRVVTDKYQTMTYYGFDSNDLVAWVIENGLNGIDRIVPIGKATEFSVLWDGYNLLYTLSRIIENN